uniref:Uncharacterized protein n=1 Tax=Arundo donax TaxID=35708 RepID=A0A0A9FN70_ARUDO
MIKSFLHMLLVIVLSFVKSCLTHVRIILS